MSVRKKEGLKSAGKLFVEFFMWTAGTLMYTIGVSSFVTPLRFAAGGLTGLGILVNYMFPFISTGTFVFAANIPLFILAWKKFGFRFIAKTVVATALTSVFLDIISVYGGRYGWIYSGEDKLVGAIFGGILAGAGIGVVFLGNATTGGMDILARLLRLRFQHISIGRLILFCDFAVVLLTGIVYRSFESIMYSLVVIFLSSLAVDYVVSGRSHSKMLFIMTSAPAEITHDIISLVGRGVSVISARGGYTGEDKKMLMCVARAHEVSSIRKIVAKYDSKPFIIITDSSEVLGQGFKPYNDTL